MRARFKPTLGLSGNARTLFFALMLSELGFGLYYQNLLTVYMEDLGSTPAQIGAILTVTGIVRIALMLPAGTAADRVPRRTIALCTNCLAVPGALTYAISQGPWTLLIAGLFMACHQLGFPAISGIIADSVEDAGERLDAFRKIYTIAPAAAFILGPTAGGLIADVVSPRAVFLLAATVFAGSWTIIWRVREPVSHEHRSGVRGTYAGVIREPAVRLILLLKLMAIGALTLGTTLMPNYLKVVHGLDQRTIGYLFSIAAVGSFLLSVTIGRVKRLNHIRGITMAMGCVGSMLVVVLLTGNLLFLAPAFMFRGGFLIAWSLFTPLFSDIAPKRLQERTFALGEFIGSSGNTIAPIFAGALYEVNHDLPFAIAAVMLGGLTVTGVIADRLIVRPAIARETAARSQAERQQDGTLGQPEALAEAVA